MRIDTAQAIVKWADHLDTVRRALRYARTASPTRVKDSLEMLGHIQDSKLLTVGLDAMEEAVLNHLKTLGVEDVPART
jgi:hypothetical protein